MTLEIGYDRIYSNLRVVLGFMTWFSLSLFFDQTTVKLQRTVMKNYTGKRLRQQCFLCFMTQQKKNL